MIGLVLITLHQIIKGRTVFYVETVLEMALLSLAGPIVLGLLFSFLLEKYGMVVLFEIKKEDK